MVDLIPRASEFTVPYSAQSVAVALNSAYAYGSAGAGACWPICTPAADGVIQAISLYISALTNWGSTDGNLTVEVRNDSAGKPGSTVIWSGSVAVAATGWIRVPTTGSPTLAANTRYWICVADPDGSAAAYATVRTYHSGVAGGTSSHTQSTANGFATLSSQYHGSVVVEVDGCVWGGWHLQSAVGLGSNVLKHGTRFHVAAPAYLDGFYVLYTANLTGVTFKVYEAGADLSSAPLGTLTVGSARSTSQYYFAAPIEMQPGNYDIVNMSPSTWRLGYWDFSAESTPFDRLKDPDISFVQQQLVTDATVTNYPSYLPVYLYPLLRARSGGAGGNLPLIGGGLILR